MLSDDRPHSTTPDHTAPPPARATVRPARPAMSPTDAGAPLLRRGRPALAGESGFTMIELMVSMVTGLVICFAAYAILTVATEQSAHLTDYTQATQQGRIAMAKIVDALHSACLAPGFAPVLTSSSATELRFINAYSEEAVIPKSQINEQRIVWNEKTETLTDYTYPAAKEITWPKFEYASTASPASGVILAHNVTRTESGGKKIPIFQYYSYTDKSSEGTTEGVNELSTEPIEKGATLTEKTAPTAASVLITFTAGPSDGTTYVGAPGKGVTDNLQTQVTLSFSVPVSSNEVVDAPCK
jgi:Tfp pilus assembly protein PilW